MLESLILEILFELLVRTIHAAFRSADSTRREALWREILQSGPMRVAFGPDVVNDLTTAAVSANNVTFYTVRCFIWLLNPLVEPGISGHDENDGVDGN